MGFNILFKSRHALALQNNSNSKQSDSNLRGEAAMPVVVKHYLS